MKAASLAHHLMLCGLPIKGVEEGSRDVDGAVEITALVHVQVPTYGNTVNVVAGGEDSEAFEFYPERQAVDIAGIVSDIHEAITAIQSE